MLSPLSVLKHSVLLSLYFISSYAHAQIFSSPATSGTGGAGRAAVEAGDVNYLNPAALVHMKGRTLYTMYSKEDLFVGLSESSRDVVIPASFSYRQTRYDDALNRAFQIQESRLSIADFLMNKASIGLTGIVNSSKIDGQTYNQNNGNIGFFYTPTDHFGLAYIVYDIFGAKDEIPEEVRLEQKMGFALNYVFRKFLRYRLDIVTNRNSDFGHSAYMTGVETFVNEWVIARVGYQKDTFTSRELITEGLGFRGPVFSMNYAHEGSFKGPDFDKHSIDLSISF